MWARSSLPTSAPPSAIILLSGWRYSSPRCLCSSKKSMLTFCKHLQNDLEEEGRTDVGKVLIANISSTFSPRCLCSSKTSMLTFSKHLQNDLEEEGRTDVGKVLIGQNSPMRTLPTSVVCWPRTELHISSRDEFFNTFSKEKVECCAEMSATTSSCTHPLHSHSFQLQIVHMFFPTKFPFQSWMLVAGGLQHSSLERPAAPRSPLRPCCCSCNSVAVGNIAKALGKLSREAERCWCC